MRDQLINTYLDFVNNYLTLARYAEHNGITTDQAGMLIAIASEVFNSPHPES
jgi:hypothetical protein